MELMNSFEGVTVGSELLVRPDLNAELDIECGVHQRMEKFAGRKVIVESFSRYGHARIKEDPDFYWSPPMFIKPEPVPLSEFLM